VRVERYICAALALCKHDRFTTSHASITCRERRDACDCRPATVAEQRLRPANIGKRKPQQTIDRECASVNYTESASAEAQFHSSLIQSSQQSQNCTHLRYAFTGACIVRCCLWITSQQLSNATRHYQQRTREKRDRRRIRTLTSRVCRNDIINKVKIHQQSFSRLCFRCHE